MGQHRDFLMILSWVVGMQEECMEERRRGGRGRWWQGEREVWEGNEGMIVVVLVVV